MDPTLGGFVTFVQNVIQPPSYFDPTTSVYVVYAYNYAYQWVNSQLSSVPGLPGVWNMYALAVYNLAGDVLINIAQDAPDDPIVPNSCNGTDPSGLQYWAWLRNKYNILAFFPGVVQSTSDEGTSASYVVPEQFQTFSVADLQNLKTPYGRTYLGIAQSIGTCWGLS
jgi:hypothetical protein